MAHRFLTRAGARLRFAAANLQPLPLAAFVLTLGAAATQLFVLPGREAAIAAAEQRLTVLERNSRREALARQRETVSPAQTRQRLFGRFPTEVQRNATLARLLEIARNQGLQVPTGDYRLTASKDGPLDRYVLNLPVKGGYLPIRRTVASMRGEFADLAVDEIALRREHIGAGEVDAQLRFVLFGRKDAP